MFDYSIDFVTGYNDTLSQQIWKRRQQERNRSFFFETISCRYKAKYHAFCKFLLEYFGDDPDTLIYGHSIIEDNVKVCIIHDDIFINGLDGFSTGNVYIYYTEEYEPLMKMWYDKWNVPDNITSIRWFYFDRSKTMQSLDMDVKPIKFSIKDYYYPYIEGGVNNFIQNYMESESMILILKGTPGTGKSTFIRHLLLTYRSAKGEKVESCLAYDYELMETDEFYQAFISEYDVAVMEDSDCMLEKRSTGNLGMHRLLNIADGVIDTSKKKIIITTNQNDVAHIDEALMRPGRCFDVIDFRALTAKEANVIRKEHDLPLLSENKTYPLSEIFNLHNVSNRPKQVGFLSK